MAASDKYILIDTKRNIVLYDGAPKSAKEISRLLNISHDSFRRCKTNGRLMFRRLLIMSEDDIVNNVDFLSRCDIVPTSDSDVKSIRADKDIETNFQSGWYVVFREEWERTRRKILRCC